MNTFPRNRKFANPLGTHQDKDGRGIPLALFMLLTSVLLFGGTATWRTTIAGFDEPEHTLVHTVETGSPARQIAFTSLGILSLVCASRTKRFRILNPTAALIVAALAVFAFSSVLWSDEPPLSVRRLVLLLMITLSTAWLGATHRRQLPRFAMFVSAVFLVLGIVAELSHGSFHPLSGDYRFGGILHPNHQAISAAVLFFAATALAQESVRHKRALLCTAGIAFCILFLTKSRTAVVSLIAVQVSLRALSIVRLPRRSVLAVATTLLASVVLFVALFTPNSIKVGILLGRDQNAVTLVGRYELWKSLVPYISERPFSGHGYGAFWSAERIADISDAQGWAVGEAHSSYVELLLSLGIPGLLLVLGLIVSVLVSVLGQAHRESVSTFTVALLGFALIHSLTESAAYASPEFQFLLFWSIAQVVVTSSPAPIRSVQGTHAQPALG